MAGEPRAFHFRALLRLRDAAAAPLLGDAGAAPPARSALPGSPGGRTGGGGGGGGRRARGAGPGPRYVSRSPYSPGPAGPPPQHHVEPRAHGRDAPGSGGRAVPPGPSGSPALGSPGVRQPIPPSLGAAGMRALGFASPLRIPHLSRCADPAGPLRDRASLVAFWVSSAAVPSGARSWRGGHRHRQALSIAAQPAPWSAHGTAQRSEPGRSSARN